MKGNTAQPMSSEEENTPDIRTIMADIRARVKKDVENSKDNLPKFQPKPVSDSANAPRAGELIHSENLRYVNLNYVRSVNWDPTKITSHRTGIVGKLIVKLKRKFFPIIWGWIRDILAEQGAFNAHVVKFLNEVGTYVDGRDASNFWELVKKIDVDNRNLLERFERLQDEMQSSLGNLDRALREEISKDLGGLRSTTGEHNSKLSELDSVARGLEGIVAKMSARRSDSAMNSQISSDPDYSYLLLENRFRGSEDLISERLSIYPEIYKGTKSPVLEIGAGRGELQSLFKKSGIVSYGVDLDGAMVERAKELGQDVRLENGISHLNKLAEGSVGGVIAIQVVEHLTREQRHKLFSLCSEKVSKGGKIIFETINPRSLVALSSNYFRDPTHVWPLHPDTLRYEMELCGLKIKEVRMLSPVSDEAKLRTLPIGEYLTPKWQELVGLVNHNINQLNELLYGYQDFCIIAES